MQTPLPGASEAEHSKYLAACLVIEPLVIEEEFIRVPADLAFWNERYSETYMEWQKLKLARELLARSLFSEHSVSLRTLRGPEGRILKDEIIAEAEGDTRYLEARTAEIVAEGEKIRLHGVMECIRSKRDMLISLGAHIRATMHHDPTIRAQAVERGAWPPSQ